MGDARLKRGVVVTAIHCHAQRQLNPFNGVLQVATTDLARAFSINGVLWQLQVVAERPGHTWRSDDNAPLLRQFFNWGLWSPAEGMRRVIANPILDIGSMSQAAEQLVALLEPRLGQLPFALEDRFEYWCCDYRGQPVALLGSVCQHRDVQPLAGKWQALEPGDRSFISAHAAPETGPAAASPRADADRLERLVRQRAQTRLWFERHADGSGERLDGHGRLPAEAFPPLGLSEDWPPGQADLVADYMDHMAPLLLMLPGLPTARRAALEHAACRRADLVNDLFRLYPQVIDASLIEQARVETRLRRSV